MKWIGTRLPFEDYASRFVHQEVQDGQVNVELLLLFILHPPSQYMQTFSWLSIAVMETLESVSQFLLKISHGRIVEGRSGQHGGTM
jgi:hypothetical protein